jgi:hypothetical protein
MRMSIRSGSIANLSTPTMDRPGVTRRQSGSLLGELHPWNVDLKEATVLRRAPNGRRTSITRAIAGLGLEPAEQVDFSFLDGGQPPLIGGVDDGNREQARRFSGARVLTDLVMRAARRFRPVLTSVEHLYLAAIHLASDRA